MDAKEITLNIAVNLGRISRWAVEGKRARIEQFLKETDSYIELLEKSPKNERFMETFELFRKNFIKLKTNPMLDEVWAEEVLTWANILSHRAKLA